MIAAYIRVSTRDQSTSSQRAEIERWFQGNGIPSERLSWYEDQETGTTFNALHLNA
jgi:DNA invertase Pin-like site-specific DNA recombinase